MIFACCHPMLARENQLALTLKTLCGFGISEIARALLVNEETIKKRLQRATKDLIDHHISLDPPDATQLIERLDAVHQVLYLIFNEGHSSSKGEAAIRTDLCEDAAYLCHLLCLHPHCSTPTTRALMALMLFHAARLDARLDDQGCLLLMEDQDRARWDQRLIQRAKEFLDQSAEGTVVSIFHLEAGIAMYHCSATTYADTDWPAILRLYDAMLTIHRSPVYLLNRAIVVAEIAGPRAGIDDVERDEREPGPPPLPPVRCHARRALPAGRRSRPRPPTSRSRQAKDPLTSMTARSSIGGWHDAADDPERLSRARLSAPTLARFLRPPIQVIQK